MTKKKSVIERPQKKKITAGTNSLFGDAKPLKEEVKPLKLVSKEVKNEKASQEERATFSLRYRRSYMDKLEMVYLKERMKRRDVTKAGLVEEALDMLFEKYNEG